MLDADSIPGLTLCARVKMDRMKGASLNELVEKFGVAKSTVSGWCKDLRPNNQQVVNQRAATEAARAKWTERVDIEVKKALLEWPRIKQDPEMMLFLGLYWGEGRKRSGIGVANTDAVVIRFCATALGSLTDKTLKAEIRLYKDKPEAPARQYWVEHLCDLAELKFTQINDIRSIRKHRKAEFGICYLRVHDFAVEHWIRTWLHCCRKYEYKIDYKGIRG